jgi:hypothetical protein
MIVYGVIGRLAVRGFAIVFLAVFFLHLLLLLRIQKSIALIQKKNYI